LQIIENADFIKNHRNASGPGQWVPAAKTAFFCRENFAKLGKFAVGRIPTRKQEGFLQIL
jgi:hypothetical protein